MPPLDEAYFLWLYSQVGSVDNKNRSTRYFKLLKLLHEKEFTWPKKIPKDANRADAGRELRREYMRQTKTRITDQNWLAMPCSFLELMISLAFKLEWDGSGNVKDWFWEMVDNLGMTECTDANPPEDVIVDQILDRVINRDYADNGAGGLFPLKNADEDQRYVELWYQAEAYLLERIS